MIITDLGDGQFKLVWEGNIQVNNITGESIDMGSYEITTIETLNNQIEDSNNVITKHTGKIAAIQAKIDAIEDFINGE